jgi:hypothetical protein
MASAMNRIFFARVDVTKPGKKAIPALSLIASGGLICDDISVRI